MKHDESLANLPLDEAARQRRILEPARPLFAAGIGSPESDAWIGELVPGDAAECEGFKEGARQLLAVLLTEPVLIDTLVFPIVFCYRQYVELALKTIVREARGNGYLARISPDDVDRALRGHRLAKLWGLIIKSFEKCPFAPLLPEIERASLRINEWEAHDPESFAYRYAQSLAGDKRPLPKNATAAPSQLLDLSQFAEGMSDLAETLDALIDKYDDMFVYQL